MGGRGWSVSRSPGFAQFALTVHVDRLSTGASRWSSPGHPPATHQTIKTTPAVKAGLASEAWTLEMLLTMAAA